jgi:hypothetical protein
MGELHDEIENYGREQTKALRQSDRERRQVDAAADLMSVAGESVSYLHSGFAMAALPHRRPPNELAPWERRNGGFRLRVKPGEAIDARGEWVTVGVPYGAKARLILLYLQSKAVRQRSRQVSMGESMSDWMHSLGLAVTGGAKGTIKPVREQAARVSRCTFTMAWPGQDGGTWIEDRRLVDGASLWFPGSPLQGVLWPSYIELSEAFYQSLVTHAVPLDEVAVRYLKGSSLALDLYIWLAHRLPRVKGRAAVPWGALQTQFGSEFKHRRQFAAKVRDTLSDVLAVYREARVEPQEQGLLLWESRPPIAKRNALILG